MGGDGRGVATTQSEPGSILTTTEWHEIVAALQRLLPADLLVISGSVVPGLPDDAIAQLVHLGRSSATRVVVDTSSHTLATAIDADASIVKPNRDELVAVLGRCVGGTTTDLVAAAEELRSGTSRSWRRMARAGWSPSRQVAGGGRGRR